MMKVFLQKGASRRRRRLDAVLCEANDAARQTIFPMDVCDINHSPV
jgi:hypothetical protein